jgi:hypothetical protein
LPARGRGCRVGGREGPHGVEPDCSGRAARLLRAWVGGGIRAKPGPDLARPRRDRAPMVEARSSFAALRSFSRRGCRKPHSVPRLVALSRPGGRWFYRVGSRILPFGLRCRPRAASRWHCARLARTCCAAAARRSLPEVAGGRIASGAWSSCRRQGGRWLYRVGSRIFLFGPRCRPWAASRWHGRASGADLLRRRGVAFAARGCRGPHRVRRFVRVSPAGWPMVVQGWIANFAFWRSVQAPGCFAVAQARVWPGPAAPLRRGVFCPRLLGRIASGALSPCRRQGGR